MVDYAKFSHLYDAWIDYPGYPLEPDFSKDEYELRLRRARQEMARAELDALVISSGGVGQWFTSALEPHEWHDRCSSRVTLFILTRDGDYLYMTPTACGEHFNTTRRSVWVSQIRGIVETSEWPRAEIWDVRQLPGLFADLGLTNSRLGFELGDCMTLGMAVQDFLQLRDLMPAARFVDASPAIRRLMSIHTPEEIERVRHWHHTAWECNQAMAEQIRPGNLCSDIYAACARVEAKNDMPKRLVGRVGHGLRNTGGLSVHPDNHTVLEPGMIISVEPMFGHEYGWYDLEDQYVVTEMGRQILNPVVPEELPLIEG